MDGLLEILLSCKIKQESFDAGTGLHFPVGKRWEWYMELNLKMEFSNIKIILMKACIFDTHIQ